MWGEEGEERGPLGEDDCFFAVGSLWEAERMEKMALIFVLVFCSKDSLSRVSD